MVRQMSDMEALREQLMAQPIEGRLDRGKGDISI
jgi:hypothetical protein